MRRLDTPNHLPLLVWLSARSSATTTGHVVRIMYFAFVSSTLMLAACADTDPVVSPARLVVQPDDGRAPLLSAILRGAGLPADALRCFYAK